MMQSALKFQGLKDLGNGPLPKCQNLAHTEFVGAAWGKPDCTSLNEIRCIKAAENVPQKTSSNEQQFLSPSSMFHLVVHGIGRLLGNNTCTPAANRLWL